MNTQDIWDFADACIEVGLIPSLVGEGYVLGLEIPGTGRGIVHRKHVTFKLQHPCRIWLMSGTVHFFLGDSSALPGDVNCGVRPPYTA